ncbi:hypothetical protein [Marinagarivorans cellulosilyticus]|uniref:Uncharacterized protein n=1 Tax=Marinagarivorans cellulosilyticus TaxID=2721545 RepID=A0AAN2BMB1_9GAMM|nr:hypothetical protein [Marinagarivorans cellulosilyticus]BCD99885.1 hypothetical protein MARGE09_P4087 [Marinagarivorans cellulosilyticus]
MLKNQFPLSLFMLTCLGGLNACGDSDSSPSDLALKHESSLTNHEPVGSLMPRGLASNSGIWRVTREYQDSIRDITGGLDTNAIELYDSSTGSYIPLEHTRSYIRDTYSRDVSILTIEHESTTQTQSIFCFGQDNCATTQDEFEQQRSLFILGERSTRWCEQGITETVIAIDPTSYRIEANCSDHWGATVLFEHISDDPAGSLGRLAFNAALYTPLDTYMGISGSFNSSRIEVVSGGAIDYSVYESYTIHAPYSDDELTLRITAEVETPDQDFKIFETGRHYNFLGQGAELEGSTVLLSITWTSDAFADDSMSHNILATYEGTLEVVSADDYSAHIVIDAITSGGTPIYTELVLDLY